MHNGEDNRLTHEFINLALKPAFDAVEREWREVWRNAQAAAQSKTKLEQAVDGRGAVILTGKLSQDKFFTNGGYRQLERFRVWIQLMDCIIGLDFAKAIKDPGFFPRKS